MKPIPFEQLCAQLVQDLSLEQCMALADHLRRSAVDRRAMRKFGVWRQAAACSSAA